MPSLRQSAVAIATSACLAAATAFWTSRLVAQTSATVVDQYAEAGAVTVPVQMSGSGPAASLGQVVCGGGAWLRVGFSQLVLQGTDTLVLEGADGAVLRFAGNHWADRTFFTRALAGACVTVRPAFSDAASQFAISAYQAGATPIASTPMVTVGAGDLCDTTQDCADTAALIGAMSPPPDVVYTLGDNQYESGLLSEFNRDYNVYWGPFKSITRPVSGNHEYQSGNAGAGYFDYFNGIGQAAGPAGPRGQGYYSYDLGDWHVVVLNTSSSSSVPYGAGSAQEQWLRRDLAANTKPCTVAQWHHPRFSRGNYFPGVTTTQALWQALQDYGADVVLSGHDHNYQRYGLQTATGVASPAGLRLFVVGTGGRSAAAFRGTLPNYQNGHANIEGLLKLTLSSGSYAWQFLPVPGSPSFSDSGTLGCHNVPQVAIAAAPSAIILPPDGSAAVTVTISSIGPASLSASGLPGGVDGWFSMNPISPAPGGAGTSTFTVSAAPDATPGSAMVTLTATTAHTTASTPLTVTIAGPPPPAAPGSGRGIRPAPVRRPSPPPLRRRR